MNRYNRKAFLLPVLLAVLAGCGSSPQKPQGKAGKESADAQEALASAKAYLGRGELDKAAVEYSRANEMIAKGKALATSAELPQLAKLEEEALGGIADVQKKKIEKEKADEEARKKEELANRYKRWRTRLAIPAAVDYLDVLPANAIVAGQVKNLGAWIGNAKKTALGRLITSPELAPLWKKLEATIDAQRKQAGQADAKVVEDVQLWGGRFQGQFAAAVWQFDFQDPASLRAAAVAEITDPAPESVMEELMEKTEFLPAGGHQLTYKDVDLWMPGAGGPAVTLLGRHLVLGPNAESVQAILDGFIKPAGFGSTAGCRSLKTSLGQKPEMLLFMDFDGYMRMVSNMMGAAGGPETKAAMQKMMKASGANMTMLGMSSACVDDSFEDRTAALIEGELQGFAALGRMPPDAAPPLNTLAFVPANAAVATAGYLNGQVAGDALKEYLAGFKELTDAVQKGMPKPPPGVTPPPGPPDLQAMLKAFEDKAGFNLGRLLAGIKGEIGWYLVLKPGLVIQAPEIGMFLTCTTAEEAKALNEAVCKALGAFFTPSPVQPLPRPERVVYQLNLQALGAAVPPQFPYVPSWTVQGHRIFLASSPSALAKQLSYVDTKADATLLTQPDFVKALGSLRAEERKSQIMYLDMKNLLAAAAMVGLPVLQAQVPDPEVKQILQGLPAPQVLFKDIPPMIMGNVQPPERIQVKNKAGELVQGLKVESVVRGPVPPVVSVFVLGAGAAAALMRLQVEGRAVPVQPPKPPGQF